MKERKGNENSELSSIILVSMKGGENKYPISLVMSNQQYKWILVWNAVGMHDLFLF